MTLKPASSQVRNLPTGAPNTFPAEPARTPGAAIRAAITEREAEISPLTDRTLGAGKGSMRQQMRDLRRFVKDSLGDIRGLLAASTPT
jgi:hypothetical protein